MDFLILKLLLTVKKTNHLIWVILGAASWNRTWWQSKNKNIAFRYLCTKTKYSLISKYIPDKLTAWFLAGKSHIHTWKASSRIFRKYHVNSMFEHHIHKLRLQSFLFIPWLLDIWSWRWSWVHTFLSIYLLLYLPILYIELGPS